MLTKEERTTLILNALKNLATQQFEQELMACINQHSDEALAPIAAQIVKLVQAQTDLRTQYASELVGL